MRERYVFTPSMEFEREDVPEERFLPWPELMEVVDRVLDDERRAMLRRVQGQIAEALGPPLLPENRIADVPDGERFLPVPVDTSEGRGLI